MTEKCFYSADEFKEDSLVLIKSGKRGRYFEVVFETEMEYFRVEIESSGWDYEELYRDKYRVAIEFIAQLLDRVYADGELYKKALEELEKRREVNLQMLQKYGVVSNML